MCLYVNIYTAESHAGENGLIDLIDVLEHMKLGTTAWEPHAVDCIQRLSIRPCVKRRTDFRTGILQQANLV